MGYSAGKKKKKLATRLKSFLGGARPPKKNLQSAFAIPQKYLGFV